MTNRTPDAIWETALGQLELQVTRPNFETWLRNTVGLELAGGRLIVGVPSDFAIEWLRSRLNGVVTRTVSQLIGEPVEVAFQVLGAPAAPSALPAVAATAVAPDLDPRLTFDTFAPVKSDRLAYRAARRVAGGEAGAYNPLVLHGPPGLGKTHLLHAIGHAAVAASRRVVFLTGEGFVDGFVRAVRSDRPDSFRARFDGCEFFLLDDLRFLAGRAGSIEQFFHTFNDLHVRGCQMVITVDSPLADLVDLPPRLLSRLQAGLVVEMTPPAADERLVIARKKAASFPHPLPDDLVRLAAEQPLANVRQLEGALNRLSAYADLAGAPVPEDAAIKALHPLQQRRPLSPDTVIARVAAHFSVDRDQLAGPSRARDVTFARHIAMYLLREHARLPLASIGRLLGGRDHSTVLSGCRRIARERTSLPQTQAAIDALESELEAGAAA